MLKKLFIRDYILIEKAEIDFESGLNIITGETGAGKSILIDAINLLIGERASPELIRTGAEKSIIEGIFSVADNQKVINYLGDNDFDISEELIIRREVSTKGNSRCFVNDTPATLANLKDIGKFLVDLHGQHEHQSLLRTETHIDFLDNYGGLEKLVDEFRKHYTELSRLYRQLKELKQKEKTLREKKELYEFQLREINEIDPKENEDEELTERIKILENSEKLYDLTRSLYELLYESETAVYDQLIKARNILEELGKIDKLFLDIKTENNAVISVIDETAKVIQSYNSRIEFSPQLLEELRERLGRLHLLIKKFGGSLDNVLSQKKKLTEEISLVENFDEELAGINKQIEILIKKCSDEALRLSNKRRETGEKISSQIINILKELGISSPQFEVKIDNIPCTDEDVFVKLGNDVYKTTVKGFDQVEFYISTNAGETPKPLTKVASGGEVSRIMLSLKTILAKSDRLPLMIFDEIDAGISGRIAQKTGKALKNLSQFHQIIAITHLPQIAGYSDTHFVVEKTGKKDKTFSSIRKLTAEEKVVEIAKLLSGENITESSLNSARELLGSSR